jgi:hypothetical protein
MSVNLTLPLNRIYNLHIMFNFKEIINNKKIIIDSGCHGGTDCLDDEFPVGHVRHQPEVHRHQESEDLARGKGQNPASGWTTFHK